MLERVARSEAAKREYTWSNEKVNKMYTYLKGYCSGAKLNESLRALMYAREKHEGQFRKDGVTPYIMHPLSMAYYAVRLGLNDDDIIATILLHDVCEDCNVSVGSLPFKDTIKRGVKYMTVTKLDPDEPKEVTKDRYFGELLECRESIVTKGFDRMFNLSDMEGNLSEEAIIKNVKETDEKLLPKLKEAEYKYADLADILFILRVNIKSICGSLAKVHKVYLED